MVFRHALEGRIYVIYTDENVLYFFVTGIRLFLVLTFDYHFFLYFHSTKNKSLKY